MGKNKKVSVVHPGTAYAYQTALAVQEAGLLDEFHTCLYYKKSNILVKIISLFMGEQLLNKYHPSINAQKVIPYVFNDIIYFLVNKIPLLKKYSRPVLIWRNQAMCRHAAIRIRHNKPHAVVCHDSNAYNMFKSVADLNIKKILVYGHIFDKESKRILDEEAQLLPEFSESLVQSDSEEVLRQRAEEADMADNIIVGSEFSKQSLIKYGVTKEIFINPYGYDEQRFSPRKEENQDNVFRVLFVGGVSQRKGIKYLLEAFKRLELKNSELMIVGKILGSGEGLQPYKEVFTHYPSVSNDDLPDFYRKADIFVLPSVVEGFGIVIVEAMASGLPVITTPNSGGPDVIREGVDGFIVPIRDVESIMEKIQLLYDNETLRETIGKNASIRAKEFTWNVYRNRLGNLIQQFIHE